MECPTTGDFIQSFVDASFAFLTKAVAQHHAGDLAFLVQPIEGMGNFLGSHIINERERNEAGQDVGQKVLSEEAAEVYQALNVQFISWNPWDPAVMTMNGKMAREGRFRPYDNLVNELKNPNLGPADVEKKISTLNANVIVEPVWDVADVAQDQNMVKAALMPRFSAETVDNRDPQKVMDKMPDAVENQWKTSEWKPDVDNSHCRLRHYVLQPLTQVMSMKMPKSILIDNCERRK